eukprot:TRINITY_DN17112_c0_g1_i1.p1 TRINITY_DN17112_c0_g1~~TRINITY_DN17112_c0_g1_i1.p1  ORF type:complete len:313 (+),score=72.54 TRINITY_DN17112_c0_g1_i1:53-940(+)
MSGLSDTIVASAAAGVMARVPCHPLDTCKARLQSSRTMGDMWTGQMMRHILHEEGVRGLYRGIGIAAVGSGPAACAYLSTHEWFNTLLRERQWVAEERRFVSDFISGFAAEAVSCVMWVPIDVIKERLQVQDINVKGRYTGSWDAIKTVSRNEGLGGLYKGYLSTLGSFGPFSAFYFVFYEQLKNLFLAENSASRTVSFTQGLFCGGTASALAAAVTNPLDMVKLRLQVQRSVLSSGVSTQFSYHYRSLPSGLASIVRDEGVRALWKGVGARILFAGPQAALTMSIFEAIKMQLL